MATLSKWSVGLSGLTIVAAVGAIVSVAAQTNETARGRMEATVKETNLTAVAGPGCSYGIRGAELIAGLDADVAARANGALLTCPKLNEAAVGDWLSLLRLHQNNAGSDLVRLKSQQIRDARRYHPALKDLRNLARLSVCLFAKSRTINATSAKQSVSDYRDLATFTNVAIDKQRAETWGLIVSDITSLRNAGHRLAPPECFANGGSSSMEDRVTEKVRIAAIVPPAPVAAAPSRNMLTSPATKPPTAIVASNPSQPGQQSNLRGTWQPTPNRIWRSMRGNT